MQAVRLDPAWGRSGGPVCGPRAWRRWTTGPSSPRPTASGGNLWIAVGSARASTSLPTCGFGRLSTIHRPYYCYREVQTRSRALLEQKASRTS
jgi:hypothetical protein